MVKPQVFVLFCFFKINIIILLLLIIIYYYYLAWNLFKSLPVKVFSLEKQMKQLRQVFIVLLPPSAIVVILGCSPRVSQQLSRCLMPFLLLFLLWWFQKDGSLKHVGLSKLGVSWSILELSWYCWLFCLSSSSEKYSQAHKSQFYLSWSHTETIFDLTFHIVTLTVPTLKRQW